MDAALASGRRAGLSLQLGAESDFSGHAKASSRRLEFSSRGDRVTARLLTPNGAGPHPVVLLVHAAGASKDAPELDPTAHVAAGHAVLTLDLPLHGERYSPKLSETLQDALKEGANEVNAAGLVAQFARQSERDVRGALDALALLPELDRGRVGLAGFGEGALIAARASADDERVHAVALAGPPAAAVPAPLDAASYVDRIAPRRLFRSEPDDHDAGALVAFFVDAL